MAPRILVLGIGNVLMGDDGVGPHAVKLLEAGWELPPGVAVVEAGTPGLDLTAFLHGVDAAVVVDAVRARGAAPGEIRRYPREALLAGSPLPATSPHEPGLREALLTMEFAGEGPREVRLLGVVPARVEAGAGLSEAVRAAVPGLVEAVVAELASLGAAPRGRDRPSEPDLWWERRGG
ncbi:MAG TPA: hydrogenase maturation protease [Anaeromyxobacteraceae bacterium]|nr:hydrogenase maturation protease [Anaeromyxobacteraceae bacterium]